MKRLISIALCSLMIAIAACSHQIMLVNMDDGERLQGSFNTGSKTVSVTMPDGEILDGKYSAVAPGAMAFGSATGYGAHGIASVSGTTFVQSTSGQAYAILTGTKGTVMEILVSFSGNTGFGDAVTNKKRKYKVQF